MSFNKDIHDDSILEKLKNVSFFKIYADNEEVIRKISEICSLQSFNDGKILINEGDFGDELFIILDGQIDILKNTLQNEKYTVTRLSSDMGSLVVGELALIDNDRRSATVKAVTDCKCLVIDRKNFLKFGDENPDVGLKITRIIASQLSQKLRKSNSDVITLFSALVEEIDVAE